MPDLTGIRTLLSASSNATECSSSSTKPFAKEAGKSIFLTPSLLPEVKQVSSLTETKLEDKVGSL